MRSNDSVQMLKILTIYAVGLLVGALSGFLPLVSLMAGFPLLIARQRLGLLRAQIIALASLVLTWSILDPLSFVIVGLGVIVGYSLLAWRPEEQSIGIAYRLSLWAGTVWLAASNWSALLLEKRNLLAIISEEIARAFTLIYEGMTSLEIYSPEQLEYLRELQEKAVPLFNDNWPIMVFVFICLGTTSCLLLLSRYEPEVALRLANWREQRGPAWVAIVTIVAHVLQRLSPATMPWLVNNILGIGNFVMLLAGYALVLYYMRHLRFSKVIEVLFTVYLFLSPWLRPILILVGQFDALFDYRYYARNRSTI